jgi:RNA recognition motif-containing protein
MGSRIYVGTLSSVTDEETLRRLFADGGRNVVKVDIVTDRTTGKRRGFAFVDFASEPEALDAIAALNGVMVNGRPLTVNEARDQDDRSAGRRGGGGGRFGRGPAGH